MNDIIHSVIAVCIMALVAVAGFALFIVTIGLTIAAVIAPFFVAYKFLVWIF